MPLCGMHSRPKLAEKARYNSALKVKYMTVAIKSCRILPHHITLLAFIFRGAYHRKNLLHFVKNSQKITKITPVLQKSITKYFENSQKLQIVLKGITEITLKVTNTHKCHTKLQKYKNQYQKIIKIHKQLVDFL